MAKFVQVPSSSGIDLYVNVDTIRWVVQSSRNEDETSMYFRQAVAVDQRKRG